MVWYLPACPSNVPTRSTLPLAPVVADEPDDEPHADSIPAPITQAPSRTAARRLRPGSRRALRPIFELRPRPSAIALPLPPHARTWRRESPRQARRRDRNRTGAPCSGRRPHRPGGPLPVDEGHRGAAQHHPSEHPAPRVDPSDQFVEGPDHEGSGGHIAQDPAGLGVAWSTQEATMATPKTTRGTLGICAMVMRSVDRLVNHHSKEPGRSLYLSLIHI